MECSLISINKMSKLLSFLLLIFCCACNDNKAEKAVAPPPPPKYYFFPKANVYFDTVNKDYLFLTNEGKVWTSAKQIPDVVQSMMDKSIVIDSPSTPVWKDNENHKLVYSALLYASPNDTVQKKESAVQKPVNPDSVKKEKKGLGKLLDRIFGRKKKDKPEEEKKKQ
jgi:hypothetical protein